MSETNLKNSKFSMKESSNVYEVIRGISSLIYIFFYEEILHIKKNIKSKHVTFTQIFLYA